MGIRPLTSVVRSIITLALLLPVHAAGADPLQLDVCYNFGCKDNSTIQLTERDLNLLLGIFRNRVGAEDERAGIRHAIALMEQIAGRQLPTINDVGGNYQKGMVENGQMDCIDESTNTTAYLTFFQQQGLLRWHVVEERAFRAPFLLDQHWSAQIRERDSGRRYVVDSWLYANGAPPLIQSLVDWRKKRSPRD